ncbi:HsdM family class I SAM-dependent methyltransferase [Miniphocaeibacter massiliensis]|uniref:HsdM family class I SAM-dependent methyltransferase n=1 Tax=Miniphocaeibacter massiliensis TaxID=2041841 RepID=UPI000C070FCD|nr:N-6 DNA methylase [Miniphocaeibacter massiliensis]
MARKDKNITPSITQKLQNLGYNVADWDDSQTKIKLTENIYEVLGKASKKKNNNRGYPDRIYVNKQKRLMIILEEKNDIRLHDVEDITKGAIYGVKWYLSRFLNKNLQKHLINCFDDWKIIGIAASGDFSSEFANRFTAYYIDTKLGEIADVPQLQEFVTDNEYEAIFNNFDEEKSVEQVTKSSKKINNLLRSIDSQKRPVLLSALMISLYIPKDEKGNPKLEAGDFPNLYKQFTAEMIIDNLLKRVKVVLEAEGIPSHKIESLDSELAFIKTDQVLTNSNILKNILLELDEYVIPLFNSSFSTESNYDIIGKFYEEFLKYAGISNVKKGIVLTPRHITSLFTKLIPIKSNDVILDLASGTGAFLIAGMNEIIRQIKYSKSSEQTSKINEVKTNQLLGFEINPTMYISSISNMMFRNDGKSKIYNIDSINDSKTQILLDKYKPTIGFINPPYSGKENKDDPTPKEITFLEKMLDNVSRYGVMIAPISTFFKDITRRATILSSHTLKYVINMPSDLFAPNAATHTSIVVFETNRPHKFESDEVVFYDLKDDGFVLTKNKGRTDIYGRWAKLEKEVIDKVVHGKGKPDGINLLKKKISNKDEWTVQQHLEVDYSKLSNQKFVTTIADFVIFEAKRNLDLLATKISDFTLYNSLNEYFSDGFKSKIEMPKEEIDITNWKMFNLVKKSKEDIDGVFETFNNGKRLTVPNRIQGEYPLLTAGEHNQSFSQFIGNYSRDELTDPSITIDMFFNVFFQNFKYFSDDNVYSFINNNLNMKSSLFVVTILKMQKDKYGYGRQFRKENARNTSILLPQDKYGNPDYEFMENYIFKLPYSDLLPK